MDLSDDEVQHRAAADRREVDPPLQVDRATWSKAGQLDWWVKERREGSGTRCGRPSAGSEPLIFVRERLPARRCRCHSSPVVRRAQISAERTPSRWGILICEVKQSLFGGQPIPRIRLM